MRKLLLLSSLLLAGPALADPNFPKAYIAITSGDPVQEMEGAAAFCIIGALHGPILGDMFTEAHWQKIDDQGDTVTWASKTLSVTVAHQLMCHVESGQVGTAQANQAMVKALMATQSAFKPNGLSELGCPEFVISGVVYVSTTSGGQDLSCESASDSSITFYYSPEE